MRPLNRQWPRRFRAAKKPRREARPAVRRLAAILLVSLMVIPISLLSAGSPHRDTSPPAAPAESAAPASLASSGGTPAAGGTGSVFDTVVLANGTVVPGNFPAVDAVAPGSLAYDPANQYLFIVSFNDSNSYLDVWNVTTEQFVTAITLTSYSTIIPALVFDAADARLFLLAEETASVVAYNTTSLAYVGSYPVGSSPYSAAFDPTNDRLYVANMVSQNVTVLDAANGAEAGSFPVQLAPLGTVYDPRYGTAGAILVVNYNGNLSVYDVSRSAVVANVSVGGAAEGAAFDSANGLVIVGNAIHQNLTLLLANSLGSHLSVPLAFDSTELDVSPSGNIYAIGSPANVTIVHGGDLAGPEVNLTVGADPVAAVYDSTTGVEYISDQSSNNLTAILDSTGAIQSSPTVGIQPQPIAYSAAHDEYFVGAGDDLYVINASTHVERGSPIALNVSPVALLDLPQRNELWVSGSGGFLDGWIVVFDETTLTKMYETYTVGSGPLAYDATDHEVFLGNSRGNLTGLDPATATQNEELALPVFYGTYSVAAGAIYWNQSNDGLYLTDGNAYAAVTVVHAQPLQLIGNISASLDPEGLAFDPNNGLLYVTDEGNDSLTVVNPSTNTSVAGPAVYGEPLGIAFDAANGYLYVADTGASNVTVIDPATGTQVGSNLTVGARPWSLAYASSEANISVTDFAQGTVSLIGQFTPPPPSFHVKLLTAPLACSQVSFDGSLYSTGATVSGLASQSYPIDAPACTAGLFNHWESTVGTVAAPTSASTTVDLTQNGTLTANYTAVFSVTFSQIRGSELPPGTTWWVNLSNGQSFSSDTGQLTFTEPNGSYTYSVASLNKSYTPSPGGGSFSVAGGPASESQGFLPVLYQVTITETSLPAGTEWWVNTSAGGSFHSVTTTITVFAMNGTYPFTPASANASWIAPVGSFTVAGAIVSTAVPFRMVLFNLTFADLPGQCSFEFNGQSYANGSYDPSLVAGRYTISAGSCPGNTFYEWSTSAGVVVNPASATTVIVVSRNGTLLAVELPSAVAGSCTANGPFASLTTLEALVLIALAALAGFGVAALLGFLTGGLGSGGGGAGLAGLGASGPANAATSAAAAAASAASSATNAANSAASAAISAANAAASAANSAANAAGSAASAAASLANSALRAATSAASSATNVANSLANAAASAASSAGNAANSAASAATSAANAANSAASAADSAAAAAVSAAGNG
jgi:YVTN family beta-propeller protein